MTVRRSKMGLLAIALLAGACSERAPFWDAAVPPLQAHGLRGGVAIIDAPAERAVLLTVDRDLELLPVEVRIGRGFAAAAASPDGEKLLVLARGDWPREGPDEQPPHLMVFDGGPTPSLLDIYQLTDPLSGLAIDPLKRFAVVHAALDDVTFVQNPNELLVVDLTEPSGPANPVPITLRSFGGRPERFFFTPPLLLPGGAKRLLVTQTNRDVALLDLSDLSKPDITVRLTTGPDAVTPIGVAVHDGDEAKDDDARIALRLVDRPDVVVLDLEAADPSGTSPHAFRVVPNVVDVGGVPGGLAFARTDGGLRLLAPIPSRSVLALVDPDSGIALDFDLGAPFENVAVITEAAGGATDGADVALLWSGASPHVAFVKLGETTSTPYKSVERLELPGPVAAVHDVPAPNGHLKVLEAPGGENFVVLDLVRRTAAPIVAHAAGTQLTVAPDGLRAWMSASSRGALAELDLANLHPRNLTLYRPVSRAYDVARRDGGRALIALHDEGTLGCTVLDAREPSMETAREYSAVLLGGSQ